MNDEQEGIQVLRVKEGRSVRESEAAACDG